MDLILYALLLLPFGAIAVAVGLMAHSVTRSHDRIEAMIAGSFVAPDPVAVLGQGGPVRTAEAIQDVGQE